MHAKRQINKKIICQYLEHLLIVLQNKQETNKDHLMIISYHL